MNGNEAGSAEPRGRYFVREDEQGRCLTCREAQNVSVRITRGFSTSGSEARKYPRGSIFLDGVARDAPFIDTKNDIYNLDHHEGCVRAFTLATCEQAMIMVSKGMDLAGGEWEIYANEPDLDTVLAIWVLLNHLALRNDLNLRKRIMPVLRLEGAIDANGLEASEFCGFDDDFLNEQLRILEKLRSRELAVKKKGKWESVDFLVYTEDMLGAVDELFLPQGQLAQSVEIEELDHITITKDRMAFVCRSPLGIYEVEQVLKKWHGDRVGVVALQKNESAYTLRQVDSFLPNTLEPIYDRLNSMDPALRNNSLWGGSDDIGGSPRATGTGLNQRAIAGAIEWVYKPPSPGTKMNALMTAFGLVLVCFGIGFLGAWLISGSRVIESPRLLFEEYWFPSLVFLSSTIVWFYFCRSQRILYGLGLPKGNKWPIYLLAGIAVGLGLQYAQSLIGPFVSVVLVALSMEILFRGLVLGMLSAHYPIQHLQGRFFLSVPTVLSAVFFALTATGIGVVLTPGSLDTPMVGKAIITALVALIFGLIGGIVKERSGSLLPNILVGLSMGIIYFYLP